MAKMDFAAVNAAALPLLPSLCQEWFPAGKVVGTEFKVGNLQGAAGDSLSINLETGLWSDFAGQDKGGDPISLLAAMRGLKQGQAARELASRLHIALQGNGVKTGASWAPIHPVPERAPKPDFRHRVHGAPASTWQYRDAEGRTLGYVCRFNQPDGGKEILPLSYAVAVGDEGRLGWRWLSFAKPRPLYGLDRLAAQPDASVLVVEGEKCADAARALFPQAVVVTWPGGSKAVKHADWTPLKGRKVVIWPDADLKTWPIGHALAGQVMDRYHQPGTLAACDIAAILEGTKWKATLGCQVRIAVPPSGGKDGWDAADAVAEGWTPKRAKEWLDASLQTVPDFYKGMQDEALPGAATPDGEDEGQDSRERSEPDTDAPRPFLCLGFDREHCYYLPNAAKQVIRLSASSHGKLNLIQLAPLNWWEGMFPGARDGANWMAAANALRRWSEAAGVYSPSRVRGRGAWMDQGRIVLNLGDRIIVDGKEWPADLFKTRHIYEVAEPLQLGGDDHLKPERAVELLELCKMLPWEDSISAYLLAGWCAIAPICGALEWRPHIWLTGAAGSGKSWVFENILQRCMGEAAMFVQSGTTEAGLRQSLGSDAIPVLFDEAEGETQAARVTLQNVLGLMRQSSTATGGVIIKGGMNGDARMFQVRSCFAFASIGVGVRMHADETRVSVLEMRISTPGEFEALQARWPEVMSDEFVHGLQQRIIGLIPSIRANARTFAVAGAKVLGSRRAGDQIGALLAGAYALHRSGEISPEGAEHWIRERGFAERVAQNQQRDELTCLSHLIAPAVKAQVPSPVGIITTYDTTVAELVGIAGSRSRGLIPERVAHEYLMRAGLRVQGGYLMVANNHPSIKAVLKDTPWAAKWGLVLKRIEGAYTARPCWFGAGVQRSVAIPLAAVIGDTEAAA